jgi:hypothetical protein
MTYHKAGPCKGSRKGHATVYARVQPQISAGLQQLQAFGETLSHVYVRAHAGAHVHWVTHNPCKSCNPCTSIQRMADFRHSPPSVCARHPQGFAISCKGWAYRLTDTVSYTLSRPARGVGQKSERPEALDRWFSHLEILFPRGEFSGGVQPLRIASHVIVPLNQCQTVLVANAVTAPREMPPGSPAMVDLARQSRVHPSPIYFSGPVRLLR